MDELDPEKRAERAAAYLAEHCDGVIVSITWVDPDSGETQTYVTTKGNQHTVLSLVGDTHDHLVGEDEYDDEEGQEYED